MRTLMKISPSSSSNNINRR